MSRSAGCATEHNHQIVQEATLVIGAP